MVTRAVSTWSLHRTLGRYTGPDSSVDGGRFIEVEPSAERLDLMELPAVLAAHGYDALQICHFHLPSRDAAYLESLRSALAASSITLDALLIDDGDLTHSTVADRHEAWIGEWLDAAAALGATRARVCAGRSAPNDGLVDSSAIRMARLAASHPDVRVVTENWMELLPDADTVLRYLDATGDSVGLLIDLGNWNDPGKYDELARIAPLAETCHAKCRFTGDGPDRDDYHRALQVLKDTGFGGPLSLIYDGPDDDEWTALDAEWEIAREVFGLAG
jgi:sugar phosphate isomerase/epimerase